MRCVHWRESYLIVMSESSVPTLSVGMLNDATCANPCAAAVRSTIGFPLPPLLGTAILHKLMTGRTNNKTSKKSGEGRGQHHRSTRCMVHMVSFILVVLISPLVRSFAPFVDCMICYSGWCWTGMTPSHDPHTGAADLIATNECEHASIHATILSKPIDSPACNVWYARRSVCACADSNRFPFFPIDFPCAPTGRERLGGRPRHKKRSQPFTQM